MNKFTVGRLLCHRFLAHTTSTFRTTSWRDNTILKRFQARKIFNTLPSSPVFPYTSLQSKAKAGLIRWYLHSLNDHPVATKSVTCCLIYVAADFSSQTISSSLLEPNYDWSRTLRMAGYGLMILGPTLHFWFNLMSKFFPGRTLLPTFQKMAAGQLLYGPLMTMIFFSLNAVLKGETYEEVIGRLRRDVLPTMKNGLMYWPICDFITFRCVPVCLQPLVCNSFSFVWTIYMTYMASLDKVEETV